MILGHNCVGNPASFTAVNYKMEKFCFSVTTLASGTITVYALLPKAATEHISAKTFTK